MPLTFSRRRGSLTFSSFVRGPTGAPGAGTTLYDTRTQAAAATIDAAANFVQTEGYSTVGDVGGALYKKVTSSTIGGFQSADGAWWQIVHTERISVHVFGAKGDDATDDAAAIQAAHDFVNTYPVAGSAGVVLLADGIYRIGSTLTFESGVSLQGHGRGTTVIKATFAGTMLIWAGGNNDAGSIKEIFFQGDSVALNGVVVGGLAQNFLMEQVHIENCLDNGLVLCGTQNSLFNQIFVQYCGLANFRLAGAALNNTFMRCGSNQPGSSGYGILSRYDNALLTAAGAASVIGTKNRHNIWLHPIIERGTPINQIRLEDDDGDNTFYDVEIEGGSATPQVYIGVNSTNTSFIRGNIQRGTSGANYAIDNYAFGVQLHNLAGISWVGMDWIRNTTPATISVHNAINPGTISDASARSYQGYDTFSAGGFYRVLANNFYFTPSGSDGVTGNIPIFAADGNIIPLTTDTRSMGNSVHRWAAIYTQFVDASLYSYAPLAYADATELTPTAFGNLPGGALGKVACVNNSSVNGWGNTADGAGALKVLVWYNGTAWKVIGQ